MVLRSLIALGFILIISACSSGSEVEMLDSADKNKVIPDPKSLYSLHCVACHGMDGKKGTSNAADLSKSKLSDTQIIDVILNGNDKGMMPYREILGSKDAAISLASYVKLLRK